MVPITAIVITRSEARHIEACLESLAWADERVVVDSGSTDDTVDRAQRLGARVVTHAWIGYGAQKNYATSLATHDWILSVDADERVSPALAEEIRSIVASEPAHAGYRVPRVSWHLGRWIRTTDWYPDWQLRLYDRRRARWTETRVHESVTVEGTQGRLRHDLHHYPYADLHDHLDTINRYSTLAAEQALAAGRTSGPLRASGHALFAFLRNYVLRRGIVEGAPGLVISALNAHYVWLKLVKLWALRRDASRGADASAPRNRTDASRDAEQTREPIGMASHKPGRSGTSGTPPQDEVS